MLVGTEPGGSSCGTDYKDKSKRNCTPYFKYITRATGGVPSSDLDAMRTLGIFKEGEVVRTRIGTVHTQDWILFSGPSDSTNSLTVSTPDYDPGSHNLHWQLGAGYLPE